MGNGGFWQLGAISDTQLRKALTDLLSSGSRTEARIIAHLAELEERKLHLRDGSESLYAYCIHVLRLSNGEAFYRITAARIARRFPIVFTLIDQRQLHLTAVGLLRDYLTPENHSELLSAASHKTKWEVQELIAQRFPRPDVQSRVRKLPPPRGLATQAQSAQDLHPLLSVSVSAAPATTPTTPTTAPATTVLAPEALPAQLPRVPQKRPTAAFEPLSEARYRISLNASAALKEKLERLRALTSHSNPSGDLAIVIERALDVALEEIEKQRFAKTNRPRRVVQRAQVKRRTEQLERTHVPNAVLREISERDEFRCTFRSADGCRCTARAFLQVHHERAWARGGRETTENLRLLCAAHNRLLAERDFGAKHVEEQVRQRRGPPG